MDRNESNSNKGGVRKINHIWKRGNIISFWSNITGLEIRILGTCIDNNCVNLGMPVFFFMLLVLHTYKMEVIYNLPGKYIKFLEDRKKYYVNATEKYI